MKSLEIVTKIVDADTFHIDSRKEPIRIANIEVPAEGESGHIEIKEYLKKTILGKAVLVDIFARDTKDRLVANVQIKGSSINNFIRNYAWQYDYHHTHFTL